MSGRHYYGFIFLIVLLMMSLSYLFFFTEKEKESAELPAYFFGKKITIVADIIDLPQHHQYADTVTVLARRVNDKPIHEKLLLTWYGTHPVLWVGDRWGLTVKLKPSHGLKNPGSFDRAQWLARSGIHATGYIVSQGSHKIKALSDYRLSRWRQRVAYHISRVVKDPNIAAMICALTVGYRGFLTTDAWRVFQNTGTSHLISISGLHLGMVSWLIYCLFYGLWRCFPYGMRYLPAMTVGSMGAAIGAVLYCCVAGLGIPAQRACLMILLFVVAKWMGRQALIMRSLLLVFFLIVIIQPGSIFSASLWLSFVAVAWIAGLHQGRLQSLSRYKQWMTIQMGLALGLLPLNLYFFHQVSLVMVLSNAMAIPWVTFIILPVCLLGLSCYVIGLPCGDVCFIAVSELLKPFWLMLTYMANLPLAIVHDDISNTVVVCLLLLAMGLLLLSRDRVLRMLGCLLLLPLLFPRHYRPEAGDARLTVLDVGQGLSAVVETHHHVLLYDAGPKTYSGFDAGSAVVVPFLRYYRWSHLDMMMISHGDMDHRGGVASVLSAFPVTNFLTSVPHWFHYHSVYSCHAGQQWMWDGVFFQVLWPVLGDRYRGNNSSCVLKVSDGKHAFLLTGDIEKKAESALVERDSDALKADVIQAPHHGSRTSSSQRFLSKVHPSLVIYPVGFLNRYHFPDPAVKNRYSQLKTKQFLTSASGAVMVYLSHPTEVK